MVFALTRMIIKHINNIVRKQHEKYESFRSKYLRRINGEVKWYAIYRDDIK